MNKRPTPISFNRSAITAIENTSLDTWPAQPRNFDQPMKAVTRRPLDVHMPTVPGSWTLKGRQWCFKTEGGGRTLKVRNPWGTSGDRLWVREPWSTLSDYDDLKPNALPPHAPIYFGGDIERGGRRRQTFFLPFSRRRFEATIQDIRIESLDAMVEADLLLEGVTSYSDGIPNDWMTVWSKAWSNAYGPRFPMASNPWVFRIELIFHNTSPRRH
jgi:hypothetical protein